MSLEELQQVLKTASKEYSHFEEHAKFLEEKNSRWAARHRGVRWLHNTGLALDGWLYAPHQ